MPISYRVDATRRLVEVTASGVVDFEELRAHFRERMADTRYDASYDALIDYREVTEFLSPAEMRRFGNEAAGWLGGAPSRRALVASSDLLFGMFRMLEVFTSHTPVEYRVFRDIDSARAWLESDRRGG